jgi:lipoate-protein ligase A
VSEIWRLLPFDLGPSDRHFALSDALVRLAAEPTVWWHATDRPTLILGAGQRWSDADIEMCRRSGVPVIRRHAGGTAVLAANGVLGLDVYLPTSHSLVPSDIVDSYQWLGQLWVRALEQLDVSVHLVSVAEARAEARALENRQRLELACFGTLSPYEVTIDGRKLVGLAQVRRSHGVLLQSALLVAFDSRSLAELLPIPDREELERELRTRAIGLMDIRSSTAGYDEVMGAFLRTLERTHGVEVVPGEWSENELRHASDVVEGLRAPVEAFRVGH